MKAVMDTNVIISGLYSKRGASYQLLRAAISGDLAYAVSPLVALEYEGKIHQRIQDGLLNASKWDYAKFIDVIFANATKIWEPTIVRPILPDSSDDKLLECAIAGGCTHIVTFNKRHFPEAITGPYGIAVMTSGEFLKIWRDKQ